MHEQIVEFIMYYPLLLFSLSVHEASHAWVADYKGDHTARSLGRVTLNPIAHMDLIGTFILPVLAFFTTLPLFGWGKPVPVNTYNLRDPRRDNLWIALAGPASNLALVIVFAILLNAESYFASSMTADELAMGSFSYTVLSTTYGIFRMGVILNLVLAFFNLIPIFPLDGGSVLRGVLPVRSVGSFDSFSRHGFIILMFLFITGAIKYLLFPVYIIAALLIPN